MKLAAPPPWALRATSVCLLWTIPALALADADYAVGQRPPPLAGGKAVIECKVIVGGKLDGCTVLSEEPAGSGFGDMALKVSKEMRLQGPGAVGGTLKIPITFRPPKQKKPSP